MAQAIEPEIDRAERLLRDKEPTQALIEGYCGILGVMAELLLCRPETQSWSPFLAREQAGHGPEVAFPPDARHGSSTGCTTSARACLARSAAGRRMRPRRCCG
ncbi:MAG: hypothetical protein WDM85_18420 [Caulobacteraceae bacterium]